MSSVMETTSDETGSIMGSSNASDSASTVSETSAISDTSTGITNASMSADSSGLANTFSSADVAHPVQAWSSPGSGLANDSGSESSRIAGEYQPIEDTSLSDQSNSSVTKESADTKISNGPETSLDGMLSGVNHSKSSKIMDAIPLIGTLASIGSNISDDKKKLAWNKEVVGGDSTSSLISQPG